MNTPSSPPPLFVVDDDDAVRDSLVAMLGAKGFTVNAFASGAEFLDQVEELDRPACLLLDIRMPDEDGLTILGRVRDRGLPLAIIMITGHADVSTAVRAMKMGAADFVEKPFAQDVILASVSAAVESLTDATATSDDSKEIADKIATLSPRERDVMGRLVDGLTNKEIARDLDISPRTVEVYRAGVMSKMGARNLSSLVKMGLAAGLGGDI